jgi:integrase
MTPGRYHDSNSTGLYLQVKSARNRSWLLRFEHNGRERWMGIGSADLFDVNAARERAKAARRQLADGIDPIAARDAAKRAALAEQARLVTFKQATEMYIALHEAGWKNAKHRAQWRSTLETYVYPSLGAMAIGDVDSAAVLKIIEPLWKSKTETMSRVRARIEQILDYATASGFRSGDNPARVLASLPKKTRVKTTAHHAALPYSELPGFLAELREQQGVPARALEFLILTASRTGEVIGATWDEIDFANKTWTVPAARMKAGREHKVPLADAAIAILRDLPRQTGNERVFIGVGGDGGALGSKGMSKALARIRKDVTTHGMRATFRTWCEEKTAYPKTVSEAALGHILGDKVEVAYQRSDLFEKRRKLMAEWSRFAMTKPVATGTTTVVVPLKRVCR